MFYSWKTRLYQAGFFIIKGEFSLYPNLNNRNSDYLKRFLAFYLINRDKKYRIIILYMI